jgi:hypothetical protein
VDFNKGQQYEFALLPTRVCADGDGGALGRLPPLISDFANVKDNFNKVEPDAEFTLKCVARDMPEPRGAIHQFLSIILKSRILVLLPVSTMPLCSNG